MSKVLNYVRKWFWLIVLACLIGGIAGLVVSLLQPKVYEADTTLYISSPSTDYQAVVGAQQVAKAFALIPPSNSVLLATLQAVGDRSLSLAQLSPMVSVTNNIDTQFVTIQVHDSNPARAARLATEVAKQSIIQFETAAVGGQSKQFIQQEMDNLENEIKTLEKQLAGAQGNASASQQTTLGADRTLYNQLLTTYASMSGTQITVVQAAEVPQSPLGLRKTLAVAIGMLVGLITIVGVIILVEQTDDILRTPDKISKATTLATLMMVPYLPVLTRHLQLNIQPEVSQNGHLEVTEDTQTVKLDPKQVKQARLLARQQGLAEDTLQEAVGLVEISRTSEDQQRASEETAKLPEIAEQVSADRVGIKARNKALNEYQLPEQFLTLGVLLSGESGQPASHGSNTGLLLISSSENGDGKTLIASQIAIGLARVGVKVVLVDANLRKPEAHDIFGLPNRVGLSSMLTGKAGPTSLFDTLQKTGEANLAILPGGPLIDSPSTLLSSSRMKAILHQLSENAFVVIDGPAVLTASSDAALLAKRCDGVLMVVNARRTSAAKLKQSLEILTRVNMNILGVVLNRAGN